MKSQWREDEDKISLRAKLAKTDVERLSIRMNSCAEFLIYESFKR